MHNDNAQQRRARHQDEINGSKDYVLRREAETRAEILSMLVELARVEIQRAETAGEDFVMTESAIKRAGYLLDLAAQNTIN